MSASGYGYVQHYLLVYRQLPSKDVSLADLAVFVTCVSGSRIASEDAAFSVEERILAGNQLMEKS